MYEIFEKLLQEKGITAYKVAKETGVSTATLTSWKQGKYTPKPEKLQKIADYLGVQLSYLTGDSKFKTHEEELDAIAASQSKDNYYENEDTRELAEFLYKNPEYKVLFDASKNVKPEDIEFVRKMIERLSDNDNEN